MATRENPRVLQVDDDKDLLQLICHKAACMSPLAVQAFHRDEKPRSPNRNMPEPLTLSGANTKEFPILSTFLVSASPRVSPRSTS